MALPKWTRSRPARSRDARFVANPGCYPTGAIGLIRPLRAGRHPAGRLSGHGQCRLRLYRRRQADDRADGRPEPRRITSTAPHFLYGLPLTAQACAGDADPWPARPRADLLARRSARFAAGHDRSGAAVSSIDLNARRNARKHPRGARLPTMPASRSWRSCPLEESAKIAPRRCCRTCRQGHDEALRVRHAGRQVRSTFVGCCFDNLGKGAYGWRRSKNIDLMLACVNLPEPRGHVRIDTLSAGVAEWFSAALPDHGIYALIFFAFIAGALRAAFRASGLALIFVPLGGAIVGPKLPFLPFCFSSTGLRHSG